MDKKVIRIRGARANNLKNVSLDIPRDQFIVITGLSGSGKSSLAFDTLYAEGQRRYVESLSSYARQFIGLMDKPEVDLIDGLAPAIAIDQRTGSHNPRSTVGTITEIYDFLRLLFAKLGTPHCPHCQLKLKRIAGDKEKNFYHFACTRCDFKLTELKPGDFSFNSSNGACVSCTGLGTKLEINPDLILNPNLSANQGAVKPWTHYSLGRQKLLNDELAAALARRGLDTSVPFKKISENILKQLMHGDKDYNGIVPDLEKRYQETDSAYLKQKIGQYMCALSCPACGGARLKPEILAVKIAGRSIHEIGSLNLDELQIFFRDFIKSQKLNASEQLIAVPIFKEITERLKALVNVGLDYLDLNRGANTLSGGEAQRVRLANQINSALVGVLYVLDEPSIGLHQRDNDKLIKTLKTLQAKGNTVIVVEHDENTIMAADHIIDVGPGAGEHGGRIVFSGSPAKIKTCAESLTGQYLSGKKHLPCPESYRPGNGHSINVIGATEHNLKDIDVKLPLGKLIAVTGVSGSGKSSLISDILAPALNRKFYRAKAQPGAHKRLEGLEHIDKVIDIDQSPIGRTPRSNPATYTGLFTPIRDLFAALSESKIKGFKSSHFSFNVPGGRCEDCGGDGVVKIEMQFLNDVYVKCHTCQGQRYQEEILKIKYQGKNILEVLEMTVEESLRFFKDISAVQSKLKILFEVGLGYVQLGQAATTLSGGEAQRIKLATELARSATGKTLYILDEPTTGLHFDDIKRLLEVLNRLVDKGNTVLIIEHNLDIIKAVDWIIDLGPEGGSKGGTIVAEGTPRQVAKVAKSYTGQYLKKFFKK
jgi:excinuclease ABC subunit A